MSNRHHDQELKARMRAVDVLEQEKARLLDGRERDQAELSRLHRNAHLGNQFLHDSPAAVAMQPIQQRATAANARLNVIDSELRDHRPRIEQLSRWLFAEKRHDAAVANVTQHAAEAKRCVESIDDLSAKRAALAKQRDGEAAEAQQAEAAATTQLAASVLQRIGVKMRAVPVGDAKPTSGAARISSIAALDVALDEIDGQLAQLQRELDEANRAADAANREAIEQGAYMAELAFDDALRVFVESYADYRAIYRQAFDITPESPAIDRLADEVEAARKPQSVDDADIPPRKRGMFGFMKGAAA